MRLSDAQKQFAYHVGCLLMHINAKPKYSCTVGDFYRDPRVHGHLGVKQSYSSANSYHKQRLAADLNLFIDEIYQTETEAYKELGDYWEALHPDNRWGGRFNDGNHFERQWPGNNND